MKVALSLLLPAALGAGGQKVTPVPPVIPATPLLAPATCPPGQPCPPLGPPAPLLAGRVLAPAGVKVTVLPGSPAATTLATPTVVGFRPGYVYRLALTDLPGHPGRALYPVLEVRGSLVPRPGMRYMEFPAPVYVTQDDIDKALAGGLVTKVVYLEDPTKAVPIESRPDLPLEFGEATVEDALTAAVDNGRLVAVLRFGDRVPDADELARAAVPGTVLLPGDNRLAAPAAPPLFAACPVQFFDPILGPKPLTEECFTDGGDVGPRIGVGPRGRLGGLNPTDVALEYTILGRRRVATANEVCICSPRFAIRRADVLPSGVLRVVNIDAVTQAAPGSQYVALTPIAGVANRVKPVANVARLRPGLMISQNGIEEFVGLTAPRAVGIVNRTAVLATVAEVEEITSFPNELALTKAVEPAGPVRPGDEVTFTLRYRNGTFHPVTELMLSDSLSGRLEYVAGSAESDRPANVTTSPNEAGSVVLRFEIPGPVPPGQTGVVKFRARVR